MPEMIRGITIKPGGEYDEVEIRVLADLQDCVEGSIESVFLHLPLIDNPDRNHPIVMYVNDSFLLGQFDTEKDFNEVATGLAYVGGRQDLRLLGSIVIVGPPDHHGDNKTVPQDLVYKWIGRIKRLQVKMHAEEN